MKTAETGWQVIARHDAFDAWPWMRVWLEHVRLPNGVEIPDYVRVAMRSWVAVFALSEDGRVPLVEQHRHGINRATLELPAGYLEDGDSPATGAQRELREEVGAVAESFELLGTFYQLPERSDLAMNLVLARGVQQVGAQALEPTEAITVRWVTLAELRALWARDAIVNMAHAQAVARGLEAVGAL